MKNAAKTEEVAKTTTKAKVEKKPTSARKSKPAKPIDLAASGLQLVETKGDAKVTATVTEPAKPKAPRKAPNWKKNAESAPADVPLVMVETQK